MRHTLPLLAATALIVTLGACDDTVTSEMNRGGGTVLVNVAADGPKVVDGRLVFRDTTHLREYVTPLVDAPTDKLRSNESQHAGFQSLRDYLDGGEDTEEGAKAGKETEPNGKEAEALQKDGVARDDFPVGDAILSAISRNGNIQVGDTVYKFTPRTVYQAAASDVGALDAAVPTLSSSPASDDVRIQAHPVEVYGNEPTEEGASFSRAGGGSGNPEVTQGEGICMVYGSGTTRMVGTTSITNAWFWAEARVTTEWQRYKRILWWGRWVRTWDAGWIGHNWWSSLRFHVLWWGPFGPFNNSGSNSVWGNPVVTNTPMFLVGPAVRIRGSVQAEHWVSGKPGPTNGSCWTSVFVP